MEEQSLEERVAIIKDMMTNPEKYGLTADRIHRWSLDNYGKVSDMLERIPESLSDELVDYAICAYKKKTSLEDSQDGRHHTTP